MDSKNQNYDVCVVGGGPAGIIAAILSKNQTNRVCLIEKNKSLGKKLLLTGKGRCNLTQKNFSIEKFGKNGKFLFQANQTFPVKKILEFFDKINIKTKLERGGRYFPQKESAKFVLDTLKKELTKKKIDIYYQSKVKKIQINHHKIEAVKTKHHKIEAQKFVLATGGKSYPQTGSNGEMFELLKETSHKIIKPRPVLVPIKIKNPWIKHLKGLSLKNVTLNVFLNNKKKFSYFGEMIFTHFGISGPIVLNASRDLIDLEKENISLYLDLKPALDFQTLDKRIQKDFQKYNNKHYRNTLSDLLPQKIIPTVIKLSEINPNLKAHSIPKAQRKNLTNLLKNFKLEFDSLLGFDQAIVTRGGISLKEVDPKTLRSKKIKNLFFAGEILDLDGPSGGYNLTMCFQTACLAAKK
ncbi:MAG: aminoacetone oxidase family FAD-binding enzyme [Candidatus Moranbacteria bacterium]|nr:aminoacetone oxidase family FAD-binding enzyme [Candidatus Moranbacteria bacterium]